jgi:hypothetical protein
MNSCLGTPQLSKLFPGVFLFWAFLRGRWDNEYPATVSGAIEQIIISCAKRKIIENSL